eukprot:gnl/Chilomastix_cuspidata/2928.p1 GENE.gnl/Chilomastix_cuspidata/2928~~gnl/Chilomastix_cuspidata/2928.p1  ORF type:complete len:739 (+),score=259.72 gnl/Chilomastix_cuspidata/2928:46-2262(+)
MNQTLIVAEKPSIARAVAAVLPGKQSQRRHSSKGPVIHEIESLDTKLGRILVTSVIGHVTKLDIADEALRNASWSSMDPSVLLTCPIKRVTRTESLPHQRAIQDLVRGSTRLIIWTDCDREGEHIGFEILDIAARVKRLEPALVASPPGVPAAAALRVQRAKFSAATPAEISRALRSLTIPLSAAAEAVETRREMDLRLGFSITRAQTLFLKDRLPDAAQAKGALSFGPCQCPTLSYVCSRYRRHVQAVPRAGYTVRLSAGGVAFDHTDGPIYSKRGAEMFLAALRAQAPTLRSAREEPYRAYRPVPLATATLQKVLARPPRAISSSLSMKVSEDLYTSGLISYPRTETERWHGAAFRDPLRMILTSYAQMPERVRRAVDALRDETGGEPGWEERVFPRPGAGDDAAHPPIHPTAPPRRNLTGANRTVYEYVCVAFLASLAPDLEGTRVTADATVGPARFKASESAVTKQGFRSVLAAGGFGTTRGSERLASDLAQLVRAGAETLPRPVRLCVAKTMSARPPPPKESDLVDFMSRHAVGTDATIASHIENLVAKRYFRRERNGDLLPTILGEALFSFYESSPSVLPRTFPASRALTEIQLRILAAGGGDQRATLRLATEEGRAILSAVRIAAESGLGRSKCGACGSERAEVKGGVFSCASCGRSIRLGPPVPGAAWKPLDSECPICMFSRVALVRGIDVLATACPGCARAPPAYHSSGAFFTCSACRSARCPFAGGSV